jgi:hypothetical protein
MIKKVVSGGQTGVDRAALDAAMAAGIPVGGYCPAGRRAEDGMIPECYPLSETESAESSVRTEMNVKGSDGTLILNVGELSQGTLLTYELAEKHGKPILVLQLDSSQMPESVQVIRWLNGQAITVLNVAGPRESKNPGGIYDKAHVFLEQVFALLKEWE